MSEPDDPPRLADAPTPAPLGQLFASAVRDVPSEQELATLAERLGHALGPAARAPRGASSLAKAGIASGVVALIAVGALVARQRLHDAASVADRPSSSSTPSAAPSASAQGSNPPATSPSSSGEGAEGSALPPPSPSTPPRIEAPKSSARAPEGASEAALLEKARRLLGSAPATALALTNEHQTRFPRGVLSQEREVIAIEALRRLQRTAEADARAAAFAKAFPGSAHQRVVGEASPK